jgi:hypothetical protein
MPPPPKPPPGPIEHGPDFGGKALPAGGAPASRAATGPLDGGPLPGCPGLEDTAPLEPEDAGIEPPLVDIPFAPAAEPPPDAVPVDEPEGMPPSVSVSVFPPQPTTTSVIVTDNVIRRIGVSLREELRAVAQTTGSPTAIDVAAGTLAVNESRGRVNRRTSPFCVWERVSSSPGSSPRRRPSRSKHRSRSGVRHLFRSSNRRPMIGHGLKEA